MATALKDIYSLQFIEKLANALQVVFPHLHKE